MGETRQRRYAEHILSSISLRPMCGQRDWRVSTPRTALTTKTCRRCIAALLMEPVAGWTREQWARKVDEAIKRGTVR